MWLLSTLWLIFLGSCWFHFKEWAVLHPFPIHWVRVQNLSVQLVDHMAHFLGELSLLTFWDVEAVCHTTNCLPPVQRKVQLLAQHFHWILHGTPIVLLCWDWAWTCAICFLLCLEFVVWRTFPESDAYILEFLFITGVFVSERLRCFFPNV